MTIPVVRKRAKHKKTKTGCLTCRQRRIKCDESRTLADNGAPSCGNCLRSGRECGGYEDTDPHQHQTCDKDCSNSTQLTLSRSIMKFGLDSLDPSGRMAFDFFRINTKSSLPGKCFGASWERIAMEVASTEPTIALALAALGSMHRAITYSSPVDQEQLALRQYSKALTSARRYIASIKPSHSAADVNTVLLSSLIFFVFELYCGRDEQAALHLQTGLRILYERTQSAKGRNSEDERRLIDLDPKPRDILGILSQTFVRLDADLVLAGNDEPYLHPIVTSQPLPLTFEDIDEANVFLDGLSTAVMDIMGKVYEIAEEELEKQRDLSMLDEDEKFCLIETFGRVCNLPPAVLDDAKKVRTDLCSWLSAFAMIAVDDEIRDEHTLTRFFFFYLWLLIETFRDPHEMLRDRFDEQYEHLTELAEEYVESNSSSTSYRTSSGASYRTPPAFYLGTGFVTCLNLIAVNCRTSGVRRRCVDVLRKINLQGISDTEFLARSVERIIAAEEERAREIRGFPASKTSFESHEIDEHARFLNVILTPNVQRLKFDFYKKDQASLLYVSYGDGDSIAQLPVRRDTFPVLRP